MAAELATKITFLRIREEGQQAVRQLVQRRIDAKDALHAENAKDAIDAEDAYNAKDALHAEHAKDALHAEHAKTRYTLRTLRLYRCRRRWER